MLLGLFSCSGGDKGYWAFQSTKDGKWGIINNDGTEVIVEEQFSLPPLAISEGRFFVADELFTLEKNPRSLGQFKWTSPFMDGLAVVSKENGHITVIDLDAKPVLTIDKVNGEKVFCVKRLNANLMSYILRNGTEGLLNMKGEVVLEASEDNGKIGSFGKYIQCFQNEEERLTVYDSKGKFLFKKNGIKTAIPLEDYIIVENSEGEKGVLDYSGEFIIRASDKYSYIAPASKTTLLVCNDSGEWGLMDLDGNMIVRPRYDGTGPLFHDSRILWQEKDKYILADAKTGEEIGNETFLLYLEPQNDIIPVQVSKSGWYFLNINGELVKKTVEVAGISPKYNNVLEGITYPVYSDYFSVDEFVSELQLSDKGVGEYTFNSDYSKVERNEDGLASFGTEIGFVDLMFLYGSSNNEEPFWINYLINLDQPKIIENLDKICKKIDEKLGEKGNKIGDCNSESSDNFLHVYSFQNGVNCAFEKTSDHYFTILYTKDDDYVQRCIRFFSD